ncbi:MAG: helix-hairpin-helix domain-containing protein [Candidatus Diapherotrites archaeon]|nr:helix-hairpin-helix domain-containing protein [Candidatus Diapherotrites archaeon]
MILDKLKVLGNAASWDSCGGVKQKSLRKAKIPVHLEKIVYDCAQTSEKCRLMKVLQSNSCIHDCNYCFNSHCKQRKETLQPMELAKSFNSLEKTGMVTGLFLSSAVCGEAEASAERMIESAKLVRKRFGFHGYIHLKALPGMSKDKIFEMARIANRVSLNIEAPNKSFFSEMSNTKDYYNDLFKRLLWIDSANRKGFMRSGFTTQLVVGALGESDKDILKRMDWLYDNTTLHRTYFSAFEPVKNTKFEKIAPENKNREHMLYQADWLLREYGFRRREIETGMNEGEKFRLNHDLKMDIAVNNPNAFPVDLNNASRGELLRVPGIGPKTCEKVLKLRREKKIKGYEELKRIGVILKRAASFVQLEKEKQAKLSAFA